MNGERVVRRAMRVRQVEGAPLYLFTLRAADILRVAEASRLRRDDLGRVVGYQRPEVKRHVEGIREYLDSGDVLFPNPILLAVGSEVTFRPDPGSSDDATPGWLEIPAPEEGQGRAAWIVDGQQRALALSRCSRPDMVVPVNAFVAERVGQQKEQFLRVNNTAPLPRGLVTELLPAVDGPLPGHLAVRRVPASLCERLADDPRSPFAGLVRRGTAESPAAVVSAGSLMAMVTERVRNPSGCLYRFVDEVAGSADEAGAFEALVAFWSSVKRVFPEAWGRAPAESRLMHGAGIQALGRVMDTVMARAPMGAADLDAWMDREVGRLAPACRWTSGTWDILAGLRWSDLQNVPTHIRLLGNALVRTYAQAAR